MNVISESSFIVASYNNYLLKGFVQKGHISLFCLKTQINTLNLPSFSIHCRFYMGRSALSSKPLPFYFPFLHELVTILQTYSRKLHLFSVGLKMSNALFIVTMRLATQS